jgi:glycosyltransferase involved in cell wall biosynthesis
MFKDRTILYIVHNYNTFQKDPIEESSKYFKKVYVLVRYKPISKIVKYLPFKSLKKYEDSYVVDLNNVPDNVEVIRTPVWYLPFGVFYKWAGYLHYKAVKKAIKKYNIEFDLIHSHFIWTAGYVGMRLKEDYKKAFVVTGHGFDVYDLPFQSADWKERIKKILQSADKVLTVSKSNEKIIKELGVDEVAVLTNGYSGRLFYLKDKGECREKLGLPLDKKIILTVGNLVEVKGYEYLIKAVNIVRKRNPELICYHIGTGPLYGSLRKLVDDLDLGTHFKFLGRKPHHKLVDYFGASDFFVSSSLSEGNPTVMFESLGCGKPFIGTKVGGVPEIINSPKCGILVPPASDEKLAEAIVKALRKNWREEVIRSYAQRYTWDNVLKSILCVYKQILS